VANTESFADPEFSNTEFPADPEFVVEVDQAKVRAARRRVLRLHGVSAWASLIGAVLIAGLTVPLLFLGADYVVLWLLFPVLIFLFDGTRKLSKVRRVRRMFDERGVAPTAMRISGAGLRCGIDAAPDSIFLPWSAVAGFLLRKYFGREILVLVMMPGVGPGTPGVEGLNHPDVKAVLGRKVHGVVGPRFAVAVLRRSVPEISQALFHYSGGRVWVR